jgi:RNA polymerase sigma-70 factor (ECF subfamily)
MSGTFEEEFDGLFRAHFPRLFRYLDRLSGDADAARDLAQETFVRLLRRGAPPDRPEAWLITVATNLWRNARATRNRRTAILDRSLTEESLIDPATPLSDQVETGETGEKVRAAMRRLAEREQQLLLLMAEGYHYREIAEVTGIQEASVGTLLARAKRAFRVAYEESSDAS